MKQIRFFFHLPILLAIAFPAFAQVHPVTASSPECDEFISTSPCVVIFDMKKATPDANGMIRVPTHADVETRVHGNSAIYLKNASPFLACSVQATPGAPTRDLSSSVTAALTTLGGLGAISTAAKAENVSRNTPETDYAAKLKNAFHQALNDKTTGWLYTFDTAAKAQNAVITLYNALSGLLQEEKEYESDVEKGSSSYDIRDQLDDLRKVRDTIQQYFDVVSGLVKDQAVSGQHVVTTTVTNDILIPMDRFRQKAVSETITCKDAATQTQTFSTMTFTAFYENTPVFDISAGAIMSTTPGRQVGVVTGPYSTGTTAANPSSCVAQTTPLTCLGVTSQSRVQFMPAAFVEWHVDWKWPGAHNGRAYHPFGYVGTLGPAFGISVNPNNGTASAEFFEGVSLGIHRIAIMAGFHNGRYQTFADGYYVGEVVPSTVTSPRTERTWTTHFAIALTYRIPFR